MVSAPSPHMERDMPDRKVQLRSIRDGMLYAFPDDGVDISGEPNQHRQELLRVVRQRIDGLPVFFADEPMEDLHDARIGMGVPVPVVNDAIQIRMASNIRSRNAARDSAMAKVNEEQQRKRSEASALVEALTAAAQAAVAGKSGRGKAGGAE
jgi:hypothetical protein